MSLWPASWKLDHSKLEFFNYDPVWEKENYMRKSRFTDAQIAFILKQADERTSVAEVWRKAGIAEATFYNLHKKYAGLMPSEMKRLKRLEEENSKLKTLVADLSQLVASHLGKDRELRLDWCYQELSSKRVLTTILNSSLPPLKFRLKLIHVY